MECEGGGDEGDEDDSSVYDDLGFGSEGQMVSHGIPEAPGVLWRGCHVGNRVFIHVKCSQLTAGSKECLASLMDEAESRGCTFILVFFDRGLSLDQVKQIMHTFHFIGFQNLPPNSPLVPNQATKYHFMAYNISS